MADLNALQASDSTKITGADATGNETNFVGSTVNGELKTADILNVSVSQALLSVAAGAIVEVKVGASRLTARKSVQIQAQGINVFYGYTSSSQIFSIPNGTTVILSLGDGVGVWVKNVGVLTASPVAIAEFA